MSKPSINSLSDWLFKTGVIIVAATLPLDRSENLATKLPYIATFGFLFLLQRPLLQAWRSRFANTPYLLTIIFFLPVVSAATSSLVAIDHRLALATAIIFGFVVARGWLLAGFMKAKDVEIFESVTLLMTWIVVAFGYFQFFGNVFGFSTETIGLLDRYTLAVNSFPRVQSTALEPLYLAHYLVLPLGILLYRMFVDPYRRALSEKILFVLTLALFVSTNSRGAILAMIVSLIALSIVVWRQRRFIMLELRLIIAAMAVLAMMLGVVGIAKKQGSNSLTKFAGHAVAVDDGSSRTRYELWGEATPIFIKHPLLGVGDYNSRIALHPTEAIAGTPVEQLQPFNNDYLAYLTEQGIVGMLAALPLLYFLAKIAIEVIRRRYVQPAAPYLIAGVAMAIQANAFHSLYLLRTWAVIGLLAAAWRIDRERTHHELPIP